MTTAIETPRAPAIERRHPLIGTEVRGVDLSRPLTPESKAWIEAL